MKKYSFLLLALVFIGCGKITEPSLSVEGDTKSQGVVYYSNLLNPFQYDVYDVLNNNKIKLFGVTNNQFIHLNDEVSTAWSKFTYNRNISDYIKGERYRFRDYGMNIEEHFLDGKSATIYKVIGYAPVRVNLSKSKLHSQYVIGAVVLVAASKYGSAPKGKHELWVPLADITGVIKGKPDRYSSMVRYDLSSLQLDKYGMPVGTDYDVEGAYNGKYKALYDPNKSKNSWEELKYWYIAD